MDTFKHLYDTGKVIYEGTSHGGGDLEIRDATEDGKSVRLLLVDGARESASFNEPAFRNDLVFKYANGFHEILVENPHLNSCLLIGGAGFSFPKHFISHFPHKTMDVVEIDPEMIRLAFQYFYLDDLFDDYELDKTKRLRIIQMDGNEYLKLEKKRYDLILNDAYIAYTIDSSLLSREGLSQIKKNLSPNGVYAINLITAIAGGDSRLATEVTSHFQSFFKYTVFKRCSPEVPANSKQNCLLIGSDFPL